MTRVTEVQIGPEQTGSEASKRRLVVGLSSDRARISEHGAPWAIMVRIRHRQMIRVQISLLAACRVLGGYSSSQRRHSRRLRPDDVTGDDCSTLRLVS